MDSILNSERGFSLAGTLVSVGITSAALLSFFTTVVFAQKSASQILLVSTRNELQSRLNRILNDDKAIQVSRHADPILNACFLSGAQAAACPAQQEVGVSILDSSGSLVAGPPDQPALYRADGGACTSAPALCPIQVSASVRAQGAPDPATNLLPSSPTGMYEFVEIHYEITVNGKAVGSNVRGVVSGSTVIDTIDAMGATP